MPKEKKKGLFSLFRKKAPKEQPTAAQAVIPPDSFADINDLIPTPEIVYQKPKEVPPAAVVSAEAKEVVPADPKAPEPKVDKARKKARAAPPPPQERGVDVGGFEPTAAAVPKKPPRDLNNLSVEEKKAIIRKQLSEDQEQEKMSSRKSSASSGSRVVETNVLHYSPQTQHRPSTSSPTPVSEAPPVERQSNIILNGTARVKSIPVTQYDGRPKQAAPPPPPPIGSLPIYREKVVPAVAPPPTMSVEVASPPAAAYHKKQSSLDSTMTSRTPKLDAPPKAVHRSPLATVVEPPKVSKEEQDLQRRYENIKSKFDLWQVLKDDERHTKEAKKLQMELIRDHDSLMELVKRSNGEQDVPPSPGQIQKKRPSIAPDTYTPRLPLTNTVRSPLTITASYSSNSIGSSSPNSSTPGTSRSATPKNTAPSPSVSPAASVDSSDSGVVRGGERSEYAAPRIEIKRPQAVDENANLLKRISKPRDSIELQKQNAINRINDEVREQRRKEHELKRFSQPAMIINLEELEAQPTSNGQLTNGTASPREGQLKPKLPAKEAEPPKVMASSPVVKQSAGISRVMVNTSPAPSPVQKPTAVKEYPVVQGKTVVSVNKAPEKIYAAPKVSPVSRPMDSPKTPPLPSTPHPKLSHFNRTVSADEAPVIYKVPSKSNGYVVPEKNNNVTKLSPVKETKQPRSPTTQKKRTEKTHRVTTKDVKPSPVLNEPKPGVTSAIKNTIATSRVEVEVKPAVNEPVERGTVSRNIADTLAKHNSPSRPALDLSAMIGQSALRKVAQPIERNGIALGRVVDPSPAAISAPVVTYIPPPPPPPPPPMMAAVPPPPPPPPSDLLSSSIYQVPSPIVRPSSISMAAPPAPPPPPPLVTTSQLNDQKQRLRTPVFAAKSASPLDLRDSLMAEIRNAGGGRGLRKVNRN